MSITYINGGWCAAEEAKVSVQDRGFRFGDGVFETIRIHQGKAVFLSRHLARLQDGLAALRITLPQGDITALCTEAIAKNQIAEGILRIAISRGVGSQGYLPASAEPTLVIEVLPLPQYQPEVALWLSGYQRISPQALPVQYKLLQGLNSILARMEAQENGCDEALLLNAEGYLSEASSACIFWQDKAGIIYTPSLECGVLTGIGRSILLDEIEDMQEGCFTTDALKTAQSVILVSAVSGPRPVKSLQPLGVEWSDTSLFAMTSQIWQRCLQNEVRA